MHPKSKIKSWKEFYKKLENEGVEPHIIRLSQIVVTKICEKQGLDNEAFCLVYRSFTIYTPAEGRRKVFARISHNLRNIKIETLYHGQQSPSARLIEKRNHLVNEFTIESDQEYTLEIQSFLEKAYHVILNGEYVFLVEKLKLKRRD